MKKLTILMCTVLALTTVLFTGCKKNDDLIRVNEVTHSIFYAPFYAAINLGYFEDEGYEIELVNGGGSNVCMTALVAGEADIILAGPETVVYVAGQETNDYPVVFGQLTKRDGSYLIGRTEEPDFEWADLEGKEVIGGRRGGLPAMTLQYVMEEVANLDLSGTTKLNLDVDFTMMAGAFEGGTGDYVTMFEPLASEFVAAGKGYKIASVGEVSGEVPFTAFIANQSFLKKQAEKSEKFLRAVMKGYEYLTTQPVEVAAKALVKSFPTTSIASIEATIKSYKAIDAWVSSPVMTEDSFNRLVDIMINAGELSKSVEFDACVDNTIANKI